MTTIPVAPPSIVQAATAWRSNADLIAACAQLGYLHRDWRTLDPTWGAGTWWKIWRPHELVGHDIDPAKAPDGRSTDFRHLPHNDGTFAAVAFDPPYKLNGTPTHEVDDRYGVAGGYTSRADRHQLMIDGLTECARVLAPGGLLLAKCQDQVNGGRVRWQTDMLSIHARKFPLIDEAMEELAIAEACEPSEDYESEAGIRLFFERLHNGWRVDRAGRMRPPKNLNITPPSGGTRTVPCGPCAGTGEYPPTGYDVCSWCGGEGEVTVEATDG